MRKNSAFLLSQLILAAFFAVIIASEGHAVGVSIPFLEENILQVPEGGATLFTITLQNVESEDVLVKVDYSSDSDIAKIIDHKQAYLLPAGSVDNKVTFNISIPENANIGDIYSVKLTVAPLKPGAGGTISVLAGISRNFKVQVTRAPDKFYFGQYLKEQGMMWAVVVLVLAIYVVYSIRKKKKGGKKGSNKLWS